MKWTISSIKATETIEGTLTDAVRAARQHEQHYQPAWGVDVLDAAGVRRATIRDGVREWAAPAPEVRS